MVDASAGGLFQANLRLIDFSFAENISFVGLDLGFKHYRLSFDLDCHCC